jgi:hypothetical protein
MENNLNSTATDKHNDELAGRRTGDASQEHLWKLGQILKTSSNGGDRTF